MIAVCLTSCYLNAFSVALRSIEIFSHVLQLKIDPINSAKELLQGLLIALSAVFCLNIYIYIHNCTPSVLQRMLLCILIPFIHYSDPCQWVCNIIVCLYVPCTCIKECYILIQ